MCKSALWRSFMVGIYPLPRPSPGHHFNHWLSISFNQLTGARANSSGLLWMISSSRGWKHKANPIRLHWDAHSSNTSQSAPWSLSLYCSWSKYTSIVDKLYSRLITSICNNVQVVTMKIFTTHHYFVSAKSSIVSNKKYNTCICSFVAILLHVHTELVFILKQSYEVYAPLYTVMEEPH